jgi:enoyl-CoA hydratase
MTFNYETIRIELRERIGLLVFNRPDKLNAINRQMFTEVANFLDQVANQETPLDVLILTGEGRAFIAGADINPYQTMTLSEFTAFQRLGRRVMEKLERLPCPVIAAVHGYAFGGGFEIALSCDVIIAAESAKFGLPEAKLGLLPGGGGTQRLPRLVGPHVAKRMLFAAETISAHRAYELNLVTEVTANGEVVEKAMELARKISTECGPLAVTMAKRIVDEGLEASLPTALSMEMDSTALLFASEDKTEGINAFVEKRKPVFKGQ